MTFARQAQAPGAAAIALRCLAAAPVSGGPHPCSAFFTATKAAPEPMETALRRHGPLRAGNPAWILERFVILAPQLPRPGDDWYRFGDQVGELVARIGKEHAIDARWSRHACLATRSTSQCGFPSARSHAP